MSISISAEGWQAIYEKLSDPEACSDQFLLEAYVEYHVCVALDKWTEDDSDSRNEIDVVVQARAIAEERVVGMPRDVLVDCIYEFIQETNTCDNNGNGFHIDNCGFYKVYLD
jgi:hypothetical protein